VKFKFVSAFLFLLLPCLANAQDEQWDTYMAKFGDKPGSVLINMALMKTAPDKKYPWLLITGPRSHDCNKQGIPSTDEIQAMEEILDASSNFVTGVTAKVLAGTLTYNCDRLNYYYVKDTTSIRDALKRMYGRSYSGRDYTIRMKYDPAWITYRTFLYPDSATARWMACNKVIEALLATGDSLDKPRSINYEAWFRSDSDRSLFVGFAASNGYKPDSLFATGAANAQYGVVVSKYGYVKTEAILSAEEELAAAIKKYRGYYNGWNAPLAPVRK
jgi:hypothetical protein